eukprot:357569-Chlamydomonas_euryale.AAC.7
MSDWERCQSERGGRGGGSWRADGLALFPPFPQAALFPHFPQICAIPSFPLNLLCSLISHTSSIHASLQARALLRHTVAHYRTATQTRDMVTGISHVANTHSDMAMVIWIPIQHTPKVVNMHPLDCSLHSTCSHEEHEKKLINDNACMHA